MPAIPFAVPVTREHIAAGQPGDPHQCAIAQALKAALKLPQAANPDEYPVHVDREAITIREGQLPVSPTHHYQATQMVTNWVDQYDVSSHLSQPRPFTLLLDEPKGIARWGQATAER